AFLVQLGLEDGTQAGDRVCAGARALTGRIYVNLVPGDRRRALVRRVEERVAVPKLDSEASRAEPAERERALLRPSRPTALAQQMRGDHRVKGDSLRFQAVPRQDDLVVLQIVAGLLDLRVVDERSKLRKHEIDRELAVAIQAQRVSRRDVERRAVAERDREPDDVRAHRLAGGCLGIEDERLLFRDAVNELVERFLAVD